MACATRVAGALALVALVLASTDAPACTVELPHLVLPALAPAPLNSHVWIANVYDDESFVLRPAIVRGAQDASVPVDVHLWNGWSRTVELVPRAELQRSQLYEVWSTGSRWAPPKRARLVGTFVTGDAVDHTTPARPVVPPGTRAALKWSDMCGVGQVTTPIEIPADQESRELLFAVWYADPDGRIEYGRPPDRVLAGGPVGKKSFDFTEGGAFQRVRRLGLRAMDLAGHLSEPVELAL